ncbi:MAG: carboxypeptidase-like regulatory domain-containing protein [Pyrinomonadaceae bacterium]
MKEPAIRLDNMRIASPCPVGWEQMSGDERVRRCDLCELHVYDISRMTRREAESLIANSEGRICARLFRRVDGTVITQDCPVGLRAIRRRVVKTAGAICATIMSLCLSVAGQNPQADKNSCASQVKITRKISDAQAEAGIIVLKILDVNGAVVAGAEVTITESTGQPVAGEMKSRIRQRTSSDEGRVEFAELAKCTYNLKIDQPGFQTFTLNEVPVQAKELVTVEVTLTVSEATGTIGIVDTGYWIQRPIDTPPGTTIITRKMIEGLPHQE